MITVFTVMVDVERDGLVDRGAQGAYGVTSLICCFKISLT